MEPAMLTKLAALRAEPKFVDEPGTIYNGMHPEQLRLSAEGQLNDLIERLMLLREKPVKSFVISESAKTLAQFPTPDAEDRERMCRHLTQITDVAQIQNSGGFLTRWLYGPILGALIWLRHRSN